MREFKKSSKLDNVLYDVRGPVVDEAARMEEAGTQVLKLNIGLKNITRYHQLILRSGQLYVNISFVTIQKVGQTVFIWI